jgi:PRD domain
VTDSSQAPMSLGARLAFLADAGVITTIARDLTAEAVARLTAAVGDLDPEDAAPLVTHIAMALSRLERGEPEPEMPPIVEAEIADRVDELTLARSLAERWEDVLGRPVPRNEELYVAVHLAALREGAAG